MSTIVKAIRIDVDASSIEEAQVAFGGVSDEVKDLNLQLQKLDAEKEKATDPAEVARLDKEYEDLSRSLDKVAKEYNDVAKAEKKAGDESESLIQSQQETAESAFKVGEGLVGAFTLVSLASSESQEETEALLADMLQLVVVLDSVKKVSEGVSNGFKLALKASKGFSIGTKRALAATGIGLLVVAIGAIVVLFSQLEEEGEKSFGGLGDAIDKVKAGFETLKEIAVRNFELIGLALATPLIPLIALVKTIINIKKAFEEGEEGLDAFASGFKKTFEEAKGLGEKLVKTLGEAKDIYKDKEAEQQLKREVKALQAQIKLVNGLADANDKLSQAIIANTKSEQVAQRERDKIYNRRVSAINQELLLLQKTASLNGKLTEEQLIRQRQLNVDLQILRLERNKFNEEQEQKEFERRQKAIEDEQALRESALRATITNEAELQKELLGVQQESLQQRQNLFTEFGKEQTQEAQLVADELITVQRNLDEAYIKEIQARNEKESALIDKQIEEEKQRFNNSLNANNSYLAEQQRDLRKARNEGLITEQEFADKSIQIQEEKLKEEIKLRQEFGQETFALESQLLDLQKQQADKETAERKERNQQTLEQFQELATAITDIAIQAQENQISNLDQQINDAQGRVDTLNDALDATRNQRSELDSQIAESEERARNARATNAKEIQEQLDAQRQQRAKLIDVEKEQRSEAEKAAQEALKLEEEKAEQEKKLAKQKANIAIATAVVQSAPALVQALSLPFPASLISFATVSALIATSIASAKQATTKFKKGGTLQGASHEQGGIRGTGAFANIEVEGNEEIINKRAAENNRPLLKQINEFGHIKKFATGGTLAPNADANNVSGGSSEVTDIARAVSALSERPVVVGVTDVVDGINRVNTIDDSSQIG